MANGNWNDVASWEYYNGSNWVPATSYPGQAVGTGTVTILNGDNITLNTNITNSFVALVIGESATATSTSFGIFSVGGDFQLKTLDVVINKYAVLQFTDNKGSLYLPEYAGMLIDPLGGLATPGGPGNCNNNINIFIGTVQFGVCTGGGALFTFDQLNNGGGTLYAKPTSNSPICAGSTIQLTGNASNPNAAVTVSYSWSIQPPTGAVFTSPLQSPTIPNAQNGIYTATLTCSATYSGVLYSNSETIYVTVNPLPATPTITGATTLCSGESVTLTSSAASGNQWYNGGVSISGATSTTYNATTSGTYTVITNNGTCSSLPSEATVVTVNALPVAPTASATLQPNCLVSTGTITVTAPTGAGFTYSIDGSDYSNTTGSFNLVSVGDYNVTAKNAEGCISAATLVSIVPTSTTTWNGSLWDNGAPTLSKAAIIAGNYDTTSNPDIVACSLTINTGVTLTIRDTKFVTIQNHLTVNTGGILEIKNQGSLVMINDAGNVTNNGTINVNKTTASFEQYDYTYWSSPLSGSTSIATTFPTWRRAYEFHPENFMDANDDAFDDDGNDWIRISAMTTPGKGCIIMGPTTGIFPRTESVVFKGTVNNGVVSVPVLLSPGTIDDEDDFNLVGNPYPSAISADDFINANISSGGAINQTIGGTLYFWTHVDDASVANPGPDAYNYTADDYAMYNLAGGVGTKGSESGSDIPLGYIASGQGFLVEAVTAGTVTFNNSMRATNPSTANTQFFKTQSVKAKSKAVEKDRFWLNLQNANGMFSQQLVGYFDKATAGYDNGYDGLLSDAGNFVNFYSFINDTAYKIQGREAFNTDDEVRLGYFSSVAGTFNINIDSKEGVFKAIETPIYLEDKALGIIHDLKEGAYSFETEVGNFNDRFVLRYNNTNKTLGTDESKISENKIIVSVKERHLKINSFEETIDKVWIYDLLGRQIFTKEKVDSSEFVISNLVSAKQTLIVKVLLQNGQIYTDKVVY